MDCIVRIYPTEQTTQMRWSIQTIFENNICSLVIKRTDKDEGWEYPFHVSLRNILGSTMNIDIPQSKNNTLLVPMNPFIGISMKTPRGSWKIPPIIFQTWKSGIKTPEMKAAQKSFTDQEHYKYICWNDEECLQFLLNEYGHRYAHAYSLLVPGAYRADFWRYCVLYKYGGVYVDAKTTCLRPLDEIIRPNDELVLVRDIPVTCLLNGFIACTPQHPLLKLAMEKTLENIETRSYGKDPLDICGPHMFGKMFCRLIGASDDCVTLNAGYTEKWQMLGRSKDKLYIVSPEGEPLMQKEYESYYKNDIDVKYHYPNLWASKMVYKDQLPLPSPDDKK